MEEDFITLNGYTKVRKHLEQCMIEIDDFYKQVHISEMALRKRIANLENEEVEE